MDIEHDLGRSDKMAQTKLKILMIHGYTESGSTFSADNMRLEEALHEAFPPAPYPHHNPRYPGGVQLIYPTGTYRLNPRDWIRFVPGNDPGYGWFYKVPDDDEFPGLDAGLAHLGNTMRTQGPFDGVIGYSQGGFLAGAIASLLEPGRKEAFRKIEIEEGGMPYPPAFDEVGPIKFAVSFCGFAALHPRYKALYVPKISASLLHVNGKTDLVVDDQRSQRLIDATTGTEEEKVIIHPGGHTVPTSRIYTDAIIAFIKRKLVES